MNVLYLVVNLGSTGNFEPTTQNRADNKNFLLVSFSSTVVYDLAGE